MATAAAATPAGPFTTSSEAVYGARGVGEE